MKKNKRGTILAGIFALVLLITVGYATIVANMKIIGNINIPGWSENTEDERNYTVKITSANLDKSATTAPEADESATISNNYMTASYQVSFSAKDQVAVYDIVITNDSRYAVQWDADASFSNTSSLPVTQTLELLDGSDYVDATQANSEITAQGTKTYRLTVTMNEEQPETTQSGEIKITFKYQQA